VRDGKVYEYAGKRDVVSFLRFIREDYSSAKQSEFPDWSKQKLAAAELRESSSSRAAGMSIPLVLSVALIIGLVAILVKQLGFKQRKVKG